MTSHALSEISVLYYGLWSDQSALPDMSSSEINFIVQFTIVCVHYRLDWLRVTVWCICYLLILYLNLNILLFVLPSTQFTEVRFCAIKPINLIFTPTRPIRALN